MAFALDLLIHLLWRSHTHTHFVFVIFSRSHLACFLACLVCFLWLFFLLIDSLLIFSFSMGTQNNATGQDSLIHTHAGVSLHEWKVVFLGVYFKLVGIFHPSLFFHFSVLTGSI